MDSCFGWKKEIVTHSGDGEVMPKMKAHSGAKKRFRFCGNGRIKRARAGRRHHAWARSQKETVNLRGVAYVHEFDEAKVKRALLY